VWRAEISKGGFNSEEKGEGIDNGIDWTASTIKGVLNRSLASEVLGGIVVARAYTSIVPCARHRAEHHPYQSSDVSPDRRPIKPCLLPRPASRVESLILLCLVNRINNHHS